MGNHHLPTSTPHTHTHNLPISWDDEPITWEEWERKPQIILCGVPNADQACTRCGFNDNPEWSAWGRSQSGHQILQILRCAGCGHDVVTDTDGEGTWDLSKSDYGPWFSYWLDVETPAMTSKHNVSTPAETHANTYNDSGNKTALAGNQGLTTATNCQRDCK